MPNPTIIAHRGSAHDAPENTLAAFERALALGADGIELDVHKTADGAVVVHHDPVPHPHGGDEPPTLAWRPLAALSLAEVRQLALPGGHRIPTLPEVLELVGDRLTVYCELKGANVVEFAAPLLAAHRGPTAIHSFDHRAVARAAELAPNIPRGILLSSRLVDTGHALSAAQARTLWPRTDFVDQALVAEMHEAGAGVIVWTANDPLTIVRLAAIGVDAICTDTVEGARAALQPTTPPRDRA